MFIFLVSGKRIGQSHQTGQATDRSHQQFISPRLPNNNFVSPRQEPNRQSNGVSYSIKKSVSIPQLRLAQENIGVIGNAYQQPTINPSPRTIELNAEKPKK